MIELDQIILNALKEDWGHGDHTSLACIPLSTKNKAHLLIKESGILAGVEVAKRIFQVVDKETAFNEILKDGDEVKKGDVAFKVHGYAQSILKAERVVLNCMQHMSGIATKTNQIVQLLNGLKTKVLDTRKTTPGIRLLEKMAVKIGGGENHRFGLFDMIMIKDNHIDYCGGIEMAIIATNKYLVKNQMQLKIEIECRNLTEVEKVMSIGKVQRIMLDNFSTDDLKKAVHIINNRYETEASGGITENNIRKYAECGVDYISVGALTHSVKSMDMSLKAVE
jgi:nicotinate-nucleotide pyrophosphorylase (carboxylating)